jgi:ribonucleoside-diphosphate reductase alpha chain
MRDGAREKLPNRRGHELVDFQHGGFDYIAGIGRFADGRLGEIFLTAAKTGTAVDAAARDAAIIASIALQYGASPAILQHALTRSSDGSASGPLGALLDLLSARGGAAP